MPPARRVASGIIVSTSITISAPGREALDRSEEVSPAPSSSAYPGTVAKVETIATPGRRRRMEPRGVPGLAGFGRRPDRLRKVGDEDRDDQADADPGAPREARPQRELLRDPSRNAPSASAEPPRDVAAPPRGGG